MKSSISAAAKQGGRRGRATRRTTASGRFLLRLDPVLHGLLRDDARAAGLSLNDWCNRTLAAPGAAGFDAAADIVRTIRARLGGDLVGVIVYGSFARGEHATGSDVDLLVVLEKSLPITRSLYRDWDGAVPAWNGHAIDLHFVHLPDSGDDVSGSWAEAAVGGVVLSERGLAVSRRLIAIRERIASGALVRRMSQGQPYWVREAADAQS